MVRYAVLVLTGAVATYPASAQERVIDTGTFLITREGVALGREEFTVRRGRTGVSDGFTISVRSFYPPDRAEPVVTPQVELRPDSQIASAHLIETAGGRRIFLQADPRRVTVRSLSASGESVRQYPSTDRLVVVDDSALALFALPPGVAPSSVAQVWPRGPRRAVTTLSDLGMEPTAWNGESRPLRHLVLGSGTDVRHLWYDARGRLMKVEIPAAMVVGVRAPDQP